MANERKTENIVRKHFEKCNRIIIEEQKSENPTINKLLKNASKKGDGKGHPEFIITYEGNSEFVIVIECKADIRKHESNTLDKYSEYAVDGALLYASFLSKEFDVLAIAVSGENSEELKVSHYLHLKGTHTPVLKFSNVLLDCDSYLNKYITSEEKFNQDYKSLLEYTKELNEELHSKKVPESQRSLLISGILIALDNDAFKVSYKKYSSPGDLAAYLIDVITIQLKNSKVTGSKLENLKTAYSFIKTHTALSGSEGVLIKLINEIDAKINSFIQTHKFFDVLGQFYVEFLRYANSDSSLGIVLTPPHITELFSELAEVDKNSIVFDNCMGTGGFLISAMSQMIKNAKGDETKERSIKEHQLIGVEWQDHIFALACSNMYIHRDGKTNIIHGDCFNRKIMEVVKEKKPTVGLLNPPYPKVDTDPLELEFVLNNLEVLDERGTCVAIIPISCVLQSKGKEYELKQRILREHTLEAVLSMPNQLFYNNDVGVVTSILIITAHKPHPNNKKTWFGYFKNDGYKVQKHKGRGDFNNDWKNIKEQWLQIYKNKELIDGLSVSKIVGAKDEWCAEAYMETNYASLSQEDFVNELKKYAAFRLLTS